MTDHLEKKCPKCGQQLRVPTKLGGMLMACPECGHRFHSDFKFGGIATKPRSILCRLFELPSDLLDRLRSFISR